MLIYSNLTPSSAIVIRAKRASIIAVGGRIAPVGCASLHANRYRER